jgi:hypothetical protein
LVFFSCWDYSLPNRIELEVNGSIELPVKISTSNWGSKLSESLQDAFSGDMGDGTDEIKVYNVNYGQSTQAFLVYIPMKIADSLNPDDYLKDIKLNQMDGSVLEINESINIPDFKDFLLDYHILPQELPIIPSYVTEFTFPSGSEIKIPIDPGGNFPLGDSISKYFLHARIGEGYFTIDLDLSEGNIGLPKDEFDYIYNISLSQIKDKYFGLNYSDPLDPSYNLISEKRSLENQDINTSNVKISGEIILKPKAGGGKVIVKNSEEKNLAGHLKIKMDISQFAEIDLDNTEISNVLQEPFSVSLSDTDIAEYINWIDFDKCEVDGKGEPTEGIGINIHLDDINIDGLKMAITCSELFFSDEAKPLKKGNNIFGNESYKKLTLASASDLTFNIKLSSDSSSDENVLQFKNLRTGQTLNIIGEADFFLKWKSAEVNVASFSSFTGSGFGGTFPDKDEDPINLSSLTEYFEGLNFTKMEAALYLSGLEMVEDLNMSIEATYKNADGVSQPPVHIIGNDPGDTLKILKKNIVITDHLDGNGSYNNEQLPYEGANYFNFKTILNDRPEDLVFQYTLELPSKIVVTSDKSYNNASEPHDIYATIMLLLHLELTAGEGGGRIKFPDMFDEDQADLFGRETPEENSIFTSLNVNYIKFDVDFTSPLFTGGKLFIEKDNETYKPILFPEGIPLDGSKMSFNIRNKELDLIRNNLISPDFRMEFDQGGKITIPRNIGVTSVKIEAKGKNIINLDF